MQNLKIAICWGLDISFLVGVWLFNVSLYIECREGISRVGMIRENFKEASSLMLMSTGFPVSGYRGLTVVFLYIFFKK